ncbi:PH domain-containing protein [Clostridium cavendishii DSM 21758]|uniref:PH domain-containing protein n=1 Tax=Clostridium cavendishii DSM 21758 TaxID=1121302 RepID=A0A1M6J8H3_9CLOT|nr:PH domain-containing protein [Clostridium cavendishii]SHJ43006.1 PH domain-containing protein [Clostridium cavendishii DSM 21758]
MEKIEIEKDMHIADVKAVVESVLEKEEVITNDIFARNMGARGAATAIGLLTGVMTSYDGTALEYRIILTNKRVILVGEVGYLNLLTGITIIDYNEIKAIKVDREDTPKNIIIELNDGKYYTLEVKQEEKSIQAIKEVENKIANKDHKYKYPTVQKVLIGVFIGLMIIIVVGLVKNLV